MRIGRFLKQFNWRFLLVRILVNALALAITAAVTPKIYFVDKSVWSWLLMALVLGILNALLKPLLQFLTLQFIFVTYGLVIVLVNALLLWLLSLIFPNRFAVENLLWALVGGLVLGLLSSFLESLLGLTMPIVPEEAVAVRQQLEQEVRQSALRTAFSREAGPEAQMPALEPPAVEVQTPEPGVARMVGAERARESATPGPGEGPSPPAPVETERSDSAVAPPAEAAAPEAQRDEKEDGS